MALREDASRQQPLSLPQQWLLALLALGLFAGLVALGSWQVQRLGWKRQLIEQVTQQLAAAPQPAPAPAQWPLLGRADNYRKVVVAGRFEHALETCTQAVTELGPGCWVLTPLHTTQGWWLLVNRGFVPPAKQSPATRSAGQVQGIVEITGLLRSSEPKGGFLRRNDAAHNRWFSRDVAAIAAATGLPAGQVAPYFVDASATLADGPVAGLTVLRFHNNHLVYALTWFTLALGVVVASGLVVRRERRLRALH